MRGFTPAGPRLVAPQRFPDSPAAITARDSAVTAVDVQMQRRWGRRSGTAYKTYGQSPRTLVAAAIPGTRHMGRTGQTCGRIAIVGASPMTEP